MGRVIVGIVGIAGLGVLAILTGSPGRAQERPIASPAGHSATQIGGDVYDGDNSAYELPSLFQPVVPEYRALSWGYRLAGDGDPAGLSEIYVTRSDGDQDRPSRIDRIS